MPIESEHPSFEAASPDWALVRDFAAGERAVKAAGTAYLPKPEGMTDAEYGAYRLRSGFYPATSRTLLGLLGAVYRRTPVLTAPERLAPQLADDADLAGTPLATLAAEITSEQLIAGRVGLLVDFSDAEQRPYLATYEAETIINWRVERVGGRSRLSLVVLREPAEIEDGDPYRPEQTHQLRELRLDDDGLYEQRLWRHNSRAGKWEIAEAAMPNIRGQRLDAIPFWFIGATDLDPAPDKAPLLDLATVNARHYALSADHDHGLHWSSMVTAVVTGLPADIDAVFSVGGSHAWALPQGADAKYLEISGAGFGAQRQRLDDLRQQMVVLGARLLGEDKSGVETADAIRLRLGAQDATLSGIVENAERALNAALALYGRWAGAAGEIRLELNRAFTQQTLAPAEIKALVEAWQAGGISRRTLFSNLQRGGVIDEERPFEEELAEIEGDGLTGLAGGGADAGP